MGKLTIIDALPQCLGPLPARAAAYCSRYMQRKGIKEFYNLKYNAKDPEFYRSIGLPAGPDKEYVCIGVKASNYFMPTETLSEKGPGGGGWILMDMTLAVKTREGKVWSTDDQGYARIYAVGDCNYGCVDDRARSRTSGPSRPSRRSLTPARKRPSSPRGTSRGSTSSCSRARRRTPSARLWPPRRCTGRGARACSPRRWART